MSTTRKIFLFVGLIIGMISICIFTITRPGTTETPKGEGLTFTQSGQYETFLLPDYAAGVLTEDYKSYLVEVEPGIKIHVLEVGSGYPVYLQHGNPTSGLLYRKVAELLPKDQLRLIMPTLVGLGYSTKVPTNQHSLKNHIRWTSSLLEKLDLGEVIYVGQDWGGPVGMGALAKHPEMIIGAVVMNTSFTGPEEEIDLSTAHALVKTPIIGEMVTEVFGSIFSRLPDVQGDPSSISKEALELYSRPVNESGNAKAPLALMRMVPDGPNHPSADDLHELEKYVTGLKIPVEIVWGVNDPILGAGLDNMRQTFPNAPVTETDAGHFLQEEVPEIIAAAILRVVQKAKE